MESLFRLMLVRPAIAQDPQNPSIELSQPSPYQKALQDAATGLAVRASARAASTDYVGSKQFIGEPEANPLEPELATLVERLDILEAASAVTPAATAAAVSAVFGADAADVLTSDLFVTTLTRLRDSIVAIKVLQEEHPRPIEELTRQLRTMEVVERIAANPAFPDDDAALRRCRRRSLRLPDAVKFGPILSTREVEAALRDKREAEAAGRRATVTDLITNHGRLQHAIRELAAIPSSHFNVSAQVESAAVLPPDELRLEPTAANAQLYLAEIKGLHVEQLKRAVVARASLFRPQLGAGGSPPVADLAKILVSAPSRVLPGRPEFVPGALSDIGFVLGASAARSLSEGTRALLAERGIDLTGVALDRVTENLQGELAATVGQLENLAGHPVRQSFARIGGTLVSVQTRIPIYWGAIGGGGSPSMPPLKLDGRVPHTKGRVAEVGIGDLIVVKQQLIGYEGTDIAHIENVLKGERKLREHSRRDQTETIAFRETEVATTEERELETTNRFEMSRESSETIKEDASLKAGLKISGKYGPAVEFAVSAEGAYSRSKEEATKTASKFSQDVTERSARKIAERVLERNQVTVTTETIEKNTHEINNVPGLGHIAGVYQWVNKVYRAQMFNYGLRTMFDFAVPEPAAFLIAAMTNAHDSGASLVKPPPFTLTPAQITESNYGYWVKITEATDVVPPPELYKTKSADFKAGGGEDSANYNHSGQISIDEGYRAIFGSVAVVRNVWDGQNTVDVALGRRTARLPGGTWHLTMNLDDERDSLPFAIDSFRCSQLAVAIEVKCQRTDRAMEKWRLETHGKLTTAHKALVADYEEKLAALQMQSGIAIHGHNPAANRITIETELKKNCISILTDQHYDLFDAIDISPANGLPQIDLFEAEAEGAYVRFFEQAFEWEHMSYVTYPYFWGRKAQWDERIAYQDPDPAFTDFLQAGYARVSVPARPGFEGAIDHFLTFGEIWNGGPLPTISSPLYLPIADEIAERLDRPGDEIPQGEPWTVRIPTNLVHLRADDKLPTWQQNAAGEWVEA